MKIKVNGAAQEVAPGLNIADLLVGSNVGQPDMVSVQLNGEFVQRDRYTATTLKENDEVDFLYFMGGGA
jgi:sulfur carrier protein